MKYENLVAWGILEDDLVASMAEKSYIADEVYALLLKAYAKYTSISTHSQKYTLLRQ